MGVQIKGLDALTKKLEKLSENLETEVDHEMSAAVDNIARDAARRAPVDEGRLSGMIEPEKNERLRKTVTVNLDYAPFIEFGTKKKVKVPKGLETYAAQFKKKLGKGNFDDMVDRLTDWVKRKGIAGTYSVTSKRRTGNTLSKAIQDRQAARQIALSIIRHGIRAQPYLFPAYFEEQPKLMKRIEKIIDI